MDKKKKTVKKSSSTVQVEPQSSQLSSTNSTAPLSTSATSNVLERQATPAKVVSPAASASPASLPSDGKRDYNEMIAYVNKLSPSKRNKKDTMNYCTLTLQTSAEECQDAILYSRGKRLILENSEQTHTPLKIQRYTHTKDNSKVIINDMTNLSVPEPVEYSFQHKEMSAFYSEKETKISDIPHSDENESDEVVICGKVVHMKAEKTVGQKKYRVATVIVADKSGNIAVDLWQNHIDTVKLGGIYRFCSLQVRWWNGRKKLSTLWRSEIVPLPEADHTLSGIEILAQNDDDCDFITRMVRNIHTVESVQAHLYCLKCSKRILQPSANIILRCDHESCRSMMRRADCPKKMSAKVILPPDENGEQAQLIFFQETLLTIIPNLLALSELEIAESLLLCNNLKITFNKSDNMVSDVSL